MLANPEGRDVKVFAEGPVGREPCVVTGSRMLDIYCDLWTSGTWQVHILEGESPYADHQLVGRILANATG